VAYAAGTTSSGGCAPCAAAPAPAAAAREPGYGLVPWVVGIALYWALAEGMRRDFRGNPSVPRGRFKKGDVVQLRSSDPRLSGRLAAVVGTVPTRDDSVRVQLLGKTGGILSGDESQFKMVERA